MVAVRSALGPAVADVRPAGVTARGWGWRHAGRKRYAVRGLDLSVAPGERVLLLGASGAGKSTLLHGLAGVLGGADEGEQDGDLLLDGLPAGAVRGRAGLVLQDPEAQVVLARVGDDVAFGCENLAVPREQIWPSVEAALATVGLGLPLDHPTSALSGGQKQRLALAGVLAMGTGLLLLDEPTANLDPDGVALVHDSVRGAADRLGLTLVVVEHRVAVWQDVVDRVVVLGAPDGTVVPEGTCSPDGARRPAGTRSPVLADGCPAEVLRSPAVRDRLADAGVWLPDARPEAPVRHARGTGVASGAGVGGGAGVAGGAARHTSGRGEPLLAASDLAVARTRRGPVAAAGLDVTVRAGRCLAVTGPNGSGKSTLALTLAGLLPPRRGRVRALPALAGDAPPEPFRWRGPQLVRRVGVVFQEPEHQFVTGSVDDEVALGPRRTGAPDGVARARVAELLERLRLSHLAEAHPFTLSGGEKRRLSVATALATRPSVLVLDEPTFGQDARTWAELVALLGEVRADGAAVVVVTHDRDLVEALADEVLQLGPGATEEDCC